MYQPFKRFLITIVRPWPCNSKVNMILEFGDWHTVESLTEWASYPRLWKGWQLDSVVGPVHRKEISN